MIDLTKFCGGSFYRPMIETPWSKGDYTYATNGHIGIRVDRKPEVTREDGPDMQGAIMDKLPAPVDLRSVPSFTMPAGETCPRCEGHGHTVECGDCDGEGRSVCHECGHEKDCDLCDGNGWRDAKKDTPGAEVCGRCDGYGSAPPNVDHLKVEIRPGLCIKPRYLKLIDTLPNARIDVGRGYDEHAVWFTFDGGIGVVMPMRPGEDEFNIKPDDAIVEATA